jgi:hypothetical protein
MKLRANLDLWDWRCPPKMNRSQPHLGWSG